jgi:hypothetical protein
MLIAFLIFKIVQLIIAIIGIGFGIYAIISTLLDRFLSLSDKIYFILLGIFSILLGLISLVMFLALSGF